MKSHADSFEHWAAVYGAASELRRSCRAVRYYGGMAKALSILAIAEAECHRLRLQGVANSQLRVELDGHHSQA